MSNLELPLEDLESADVKESADGDESADEDELRAVAKMFDTVDSADNLPNASTFAKDQRNVFISGLRYFKISKTIKTFFVQKWLFI